MKSHVTVTKKEESKKSREVLEDGNRDARWNWKGSSRLKPSEAGRNQCGCMIVSGNPPSSFLGFEGERFSQQNRRDEGMNGRRHKGTVLRQCDSSMMVY